MAGILIFAILISLLGTMVYQRYLIKEKNKKRQAYDSLIATRDKLQETLAHSISATKTLSFFIEQDGAVKDFDLIASELLAVNTDIDVLELVPDGVIRYVYPLKGNEAVLGYSILKDPLRRAEALKAIRNKEGFFAGPFVLKQGGLAIVGRLPVYRQKKFWGFSAAVIKMPTLLKAAGIDNNDGSDYYFQLSKINPQTQVEEFFIPQPKGVQHNVLTSVDIPIGGWKLSSIPVNNRTGYGDILLLGILGFAFSLVGGIIGFAWTKRPEKLDQLVRIRTVELKESEERYRSLIEQASDGIIVYSLDGTIHQFNKSAYRETGYTEAEFSKLNLKDLLVQGQMHMRPLRTSGKETGKTSILQRKLNKKDGSQMDIEINVSMLSDTTLLAFVRNITARKNAERALKESEQKFSRVFQSGLLGLAICNEQKRLIDANDCFAAMLGATHEELIGADSSLSGLVNCKSIKNREEILESVSQKVRADGMLKNHEIQIIQQDGKSTFLLISIEPLRIKDQNNWLTTAIDITEKKNAELSLMQNELKYRSLIEQASDGIVISGTDGIIREVNRSICLLSGYDSREMLGQPLSRFIPKEDITQQPFRIQELMEGKTLQYERRILRKDETVIDVEINSKMTDENTLIGFIRDITERKKAEEELKKSNERFELIARATNDAIWDYDFVKNETVGNQNLYNLFGVIQRNDKIDLDLFASRIHEEDRKRVTEIMSTGINRKSISTNAEFRFKMPDETYRHFHDRAYIKYDEAGTPVRMVGVLQDITGRIKDGEKLFKEKELSDSIINSLPAVFYLYNQDGKFLRWNKNFETVTGYDSEEMKTLHPIQLFDEDEKELLQEKIGNVFITGHDNVEANFMTKDKRKIPYYFSGMRIEYEGEICLMGFGLDFSDKVASDKVIKDSEQKFRGLVEQAADGVAILSEDGTSLYISPSVERILGYTESETKLLNLFDLIHPEDIDPVKKIFEQVLQNPGLPVKGITSRVLHKDGSWRWLEDTITNMLHIPSINGIVENFRDVTEKLRIEQKIINEKELSDSIINSLPGIFYLFDHTNRFIRWNQNFETVTGYSAAEIGEMRPEDFIVPEQMPRMKQQTGDVFKKRMPGAEFLLLTKRGTRHPFYYNSVAIEHEGIPSIAVMGLDVTDRKKIEQELVISNQHLEHKASELKMSYSELERFAYIVSHDLQEPLRMVSSFLKLLEQKYNAQLDGTAKKYIHFAVDGADRMKQLIADLLEYSRTGSNKDIAIDTDMNEVMADVIKILENSILEEKAVVEIARLPILPQTSKIQMFQLMQNLLGNALKYHSEDKPHIKIDVLEEKDQWIFSITDNGIGIDPKFSEKIFVIFQRLHNKNEFSGTGIGLSICKKIVEKHRGRIWVESSLGNGSTFFFSMPKKYQAQ
ncbi:MAG: PAS domain S-box protein [Ferruginibacter sp.]